MHHQHLHRVPKSPLSRSAAARSLAVPTLAIGLLHASLAGSVLGSETLPLARSGRLLTVQVSLEGSGPYRFLLDNGSSVTTVSPALAEQLGLRRIGSRWVATLSSRQVVPVVALSGLTLGSRRLQALDVLVLDPSPDRKASGTVGLLGQDVLSQWNYHLDYGAGVLRLEEEPGELAGELVGERLVATRRGGRLVLEARAGRRGPVGRFLLDSGASKILLFGVSGRRFAGAARGAARIGRRPSLVQDPLRRTPGVEVVLRRLEVADQALHWVDATLVPPRAGAPERAETGLLPTHLFRSLYVDNREGYVLINPESRHGSG